MSDQSKWMMATWEVEIDGSITIYTVTTEEEATALDDLVTSESKRIRVKGGTISVRRI